MEANAGVAAVPTACPIEICTFGLDGVTVTPVPAVIDKAPVKELSDETPAEAKVVQVPFPLASETRTFPAPAPAVSLMEAVVSNPAELRVRRSPEPARKMQKLVWA
jgi:hypothetical protein